MPVIEHDYDDTLIRAEIDGAELSPNDVRKLELHLSAHEGDVITRTKVIGYYATIGWKTASAAHRYAEHLSRMIDSRPDDSIHGFILAPLRTKAAMEKIKSHWLAQVRRHPINLKILDNAAGACQFTCSDDLTAEKLWKRAMKLDPLNEDFPRELSRIYELGSIHGSLSVRKTNAKKAVRYLFKALMLHTKHPCESYLSVYKETAIEALAKRTLALRLVLETRKLANALIDLKPVKTSTITPRGIRRWTMYTEARYKGNMLLGKAAVLSGDFETAGQSLGNMSKSLFPPRPDWELAQNLLDQGEGKVVIRYLKACLRHSRAKGPSLDHLSSDSRSENAPSNKKTKKDSLANFPATPEAQGERFVQQIEAIRRGEKPKLG